MATAFGQLTNALGQRQSHPTPKEDDECDLYAKLLSTKLRELSKDERKLVIRHNIDVHDVRHAWHRLARRHACEHLVWRARPAGLLAVLLARMFAGLRGTRVNLARKSRGRNK
ncbi:hypothetical protein EVAR_77423_1 [Eumeta japonica]|uniref:Uncharacterized protein n=1 Tax=Eumeta variegata TaxID=151549 RepID=A0A4C1UYM5_EUMVA|nr:hypothetical protein EVAR_77423_1 [Eumeta japonica]